MCKLFEKQVKELEERGHTHQCAVSQVWEGSECKCILTPNGDYDFEDQKCEGCSVEPCLDCYGRKEK